MLAKFSVMIVVWMLGGGSIIYDGWEIWGKPPMTSQTGMAPMSDARMTRYDGKSTLDILIEFLIQMRKMISTAFSGLVSKLTGRSAAPPPEPSKMEKLRSYIRPSSRASLPTEDTFWDAALMELNRGWSDVKQEALRLRDSIMEVVHNNEFLSVTWTLFTAWEDYTVFFLGVVMPVVMPHMWPRLGNYFWSLIALLQWMMGKKDSKLANHLGWNDRIETNSTKTTTTKVETGGGHSEVVEAASVEAQEVPKDASKEETETPSKVPAEVTTTTTTFPAKSSPAINEAKKHRIDAVWRNCNSETTCQEKVDSRKNITRREKLGLPSYNIHDIRRVAPPIDPRTTVRSAIEEVERKRQAKVAAALQRDEGETLFDEYEMEEEDPELIRLIDERLGDLPHDDVIGDATTPNLAPAVLTSKKGPEVGVSEPLEDGDAAMRSSVDVELRRDSVKHRIQGVKAELLALSDLVESTTEIVENTDF